MQSIGERLEEARKRRGISVREASEATKIRGDFLLSFESNQFEVGLPEIYVRGFLRNYAGFLKVDSEKLVADFNSTLLGDAKPRKDTRELYGRMELPERPRVTSDGAGATAAAPAPRRRAEEAPEAPREAISPELANYIKIGAIIVAALIAILVIVWLLQAIINKESPSPAQPTQTTTAATETITLIATDDVYVKVTQLADNATIFEGPVARGERRAIAITGRVSIMYNIGRNLRIEKDGRQYRMTREDVGRSYFPP